MQTIDLLLQLPLAIGVFKGQDYIIELANDKALELWGKTKEQALHKPVFMVFPELLEQGFDQILHRVFVDGERFVANEHPVELVRNGVKELIYVNFSYDPLRNTLNEVEGFIATGTDVTELVMARKRVNEVNTSLNFRNALLEAHNEATPYAILIVGNDGKIVSYTKQFVQLWQMPQVIVDDEDDEAALHFATTVVADPDAFMERVQYLYQHPEETSYDIIPFKDGRLIERYGRAVIGNDGTYFGWAWHFRDITDQHKADHDLMQKNTELHGLYQELQFVTNTMPQLVWSTEPDGRSVYFNKQWMEYTGTTLEEVKGNGWANALHPDDHDRALAAWQEAARTGGKYEIEYRLKRYDGVYRWFLARGTPMLDSSGAIVKWYGTTTDIEEQKNTEVRLEERFQERTTVLDEQRSLINKLLAHSPSGITVSEVIRNEAGEIIDGHTILANAITETYTGIPLDTLLSKKNSEVDPNLMDNPLFQQALHTLATGEPFITQYYLEPTGRWLELSVARMDENRLINLFTDVTPIKEAQLELEKKLEELKRTNADLEHFTFAASHDMKEPIRKVNLFADRLRESLGPQLDEHQQYYFKRMEVALKRMSSLIDDLLSYSYANQKVGVESDVDLNQVMQQVLDDLDVAIEEKKAKVTVDTLFIMKGHERQLLQAFHNLVNNALKYSKPDTTPDIRVGCRTVNGKEMMARLSMIDPLLNYHLIEVRDNGIGFEQKDAERIFNVFQRLHASAPYRGTGIGLSIVRKVVENHGGYVLAEGKPEAGAVFSVLLPIN